MSKASSQLPGVPAAKAVEVALLAIHGIQGHPPGEQVAGIAFLMRVMVAQLGLNLSDLMNQSQRRYDFVDTFFAREAQALSDYVNGELQ